MNSFGTLILIVISNENINVSIMEFSQAFRQPVFTGGLSACAPNVRDGTWLKAVPNMGMGGIAALTRGFGYQRKNFLKLNVCKHFLLHTTAHKANFLKRHHFANCKFQVSKSTKQTSQLTNYHCFVLSEMELSDRMKE